MINNNNCRPIDSIQSNKIDFEQKFSLHVLCFMVSCLVFVVSIRYYYLNGFRVPN